MKKETKELIQWINTILNDHKRILEELKEPVAPYNAKRKKAMVFLDSLPEIESHLCRGGYIQDKNGTPCCDGDEVILTGDDETFKKEEITELKGMLQWDRDHFNIVFPTGKKCLILYLDTFSNFEKVKE